MNDNEQTQNPFLPYVLGAAGGIIGAILGVVLFRFAYSEGFYMLALPGALIGIGCGMLSRRTSISLAIYCILLAAGVTLYAEWGRYDETFTEFISTLGSLQQTTFIMFGLGVLFAGWFGFGRKSNYAV